MNRRRRIVGTAVLAVIGLLSAVIWRVELEYHGWYGLIWISYFHWAIPIGVGLFLGWMGLFCEIRPIPKRLLMLMLAAFYAVVTYMFVLKTCVWLWSQGVMAPPIWMWAPPYRAWIYRHGIWFVYVSVPVYAWAIARLAGVRLTTVGILLGWIVFLGAYPVAIKMLYVTNHTGLYDAPIHTIKSGFIIPLLIVGLGLPFVLARPAEGNGHRRLTAGGARPTEAA